MLFSEPKIPQYYRSGAAGDAVGSFSALQRAENSSIETGSKATTQAYIVSVLFSEPKIPQSAFRCAECENKARGFSALQRAENSSIRSRQFPRTSVVSFSALQRAENSSMVQYNGAVVPVRRRFSALQRAENSSIQISTSTMLPSRKSFSALQRAENSSIDTRIDAFTGSSSVSVLFSEPKIPQ